MAGLKDKRGFIDKDPARPLGTAGRGILDETLGGDARTAYGRPIERPAV